MMKEMYVALGMHTCSEKTTFRQRQLSHRGLGEGDYGTRSRTAEPYSSYRSELYCEGAEGSKVLLKTLKPLIKLWLLSSFSDEFSVEWADGPKARM